MKNILRNCLIVLALSGCASAVVRTEDILERTAFTLGVNAKSIRISNRRDNGLRTDYVATTSSGGKYSCYVEGTFSITGRIISDAICSRAGTGNLGPSGSCNALLKAAGKC